MIRKSYKFRLKPNEAQKEFFNKNIGCSRFVYNYILSEREQEYQNKLDIQNIANMYNANFDYVYSKETTMKQLKTEFEWLKEVESSSLQQSIRDLDKAYKNHFRKLKNQKKTSINYKSKKNVKESFRIVNNKNIRVEGNLIKMPKIGFVRFKKSREVEGEIVNITISGNTLGHYYASVNVLLDKDLTLKKLSNSIGVDLGLKSFGVTSLNEKISSPKSSKQYENKLAIEQRKLSKMEKGSSNRLKQRKKVFKIHQKISNIRKDFLQKLSTKLINENQVICLEDLDVKSMLRNSRLSKSISDVGWSSFFSMLEYKANWYGREVIKVDRFFPSSKLCSSCGSLQDMPLSKRVYSCSCGLKIDRDYNASLNILKEGLRIRRAGTAQIAC